MIEGMAYFDDLVGLWNWLPAFRAIAETEHLPSAAEMLGITPSAVSRTLRHLEEALGQPLFARVGRRLQLNDAGTRLRESLRVGMRHIHMGVRTATGDPGPRELRVVGNGVATLACALPMLQRVQEQFVDTKGVLLTASPSEASELLLQGRADIAVHSSFVEHPELTTTPIGNVENGLFCGPAHPLAKETRVELAALGDFAFTAPPPDALGKTGEGWPPELPRRVSLHAAQMHVGAEACRTSTLLAVLPAYIGKLHGLVRLETDRPLAPIPVVAVTRKQLEGGMRFSILLRILEAVLAEHTAA